MIHLDGTPNSPEGLIDSDAWARLTDDPSSRIRAISFPGSAGKAGQAASPHPQDFPAQQERGITVGADPDQVGPVSPDPGR